MDDVDPMVMGGALIETLEQVSDAIFAAIAVTGETDSDEALRWMAEDVPTHVLVGVYCQIMVLVTEVLLDMAGKTIEIPCGCEGEVCGPHALEWLLGQVGEQYATMMAEHVARKL